MVAFVLTSSDYHQSMRCSFLHFKWSQGGRIEVVPQNLKITVCSDKHKENLKKEKLWWCSSFLFFFFSEKKDILFFGVSWGGKVRPAFLEIVRKANICDVCWHRGCGALCPRVAKRTASRWVAQSEKLMSEQRDFPGLSFMAIER